MSFNSRGFSEQKQEFCKSLISKSVIGDKEAIFCNQENFLLKSSSYKISRTFENHHCIIKPAIKSNHDKGRARNGMFIAIPQSLKSHVQDISPSSWRLQAIMISLASSKILLINSYFPTDPKNNTFDDDELNETLEAINTVLHDYNFDSVILLGDINCDFTRNSRFSQKISSFLLECNLLQAWERFDVDFTHFQETNDITHVSKIDHFFWSPSFDLKVTTAGVIHHNDNMSDHAPIYCSVDIASPSTIEIVADIPPPVLKPSWKRATVEQRRSFPIILNEKLAQVSLSETVKNCSNVKCRDTSHCNEIDKFISSLLECVENAAIEALPVPHPPKLRKIVPGWKSEVKPFRDTAYFWHQIWVSSGKPINTELHRIMKKTRNTYHFHFRKCKKSEELITKNKLLDACINGNGDLFLEIKKLRRSKPVAATSMDGVTDDIPGHFKNIFSNIYNSADDKDELADVLSEVEDKIDVSSVADVRLVTPEIVRKAAKNLNDSKSDPELNFSSDCIKNGTPELFEKLATAMQSFLIHGHVTHYLLLATLVPLVKNKLGNLNSSKNYRTIAISSLVLKLFDWIIILLFGNRLGIDDLQFAYQPGVSANMCTWTVIETVSYFLRNGGDVYCCLMDMTKAFDLVKHSILFRKFLKAGLPVIFIRLLIFIYINQYANINWNNSFSTIFSMTNGVRQGAILSGFAYCFYVNDLFAILRRNKSGCWVKGSFFGILGYSDDSLLLAPSLEALQEMIKTCEDYAKSHNLCFSTDQDPNKCKTKCLAYLQKNRSLPPMYLCGNPLPWVSSAKHLGITLENKIDGLKKEILIKRADFIKKNNEIIQEFHFSHPETKIKINSIYNSHFTGSSLWNLFCREAVMVENSWNVAMRLMLDLPRETHRYFIEPLSNTFHIRKILIQRFLKFIRQIRNSNKKSTKFLLNAIMEDTSSTTGSNLRNILIQTSKFSIHDLVPNDALSIEYHPIAFSDKWKVQFISEIIHIKHKQLNIMNLTEEDLEEMLTILCVS